MMLRVHVNVFIRTTVAQPAGEVNGRFAQIPRDIWRRRLVDLPHALCLTLGYAQVIIFITWRLFLLKGRFL